MYDKRCPHSAYDYRSAFHSIRRIYGTMLSIQRTQRPIHLLQQRRCMTKHCTLLYAQRTPIPKCSRTRSHCGLPAFEHLRTRYTFPRCRARTKEARSVNATPSSKLLTESKDMPGGGQNRGRLVGARAAAAKSSLLRYTIRWQEIAMLHRVLEAGSNRRPAGETLERVGRALKGGAPFVLCSKCAVVVCF